ncbi:FIG00989271: hypothetical protein [Candidatus Phaeomarinobacter ectocarpi]|uniref:Protein NO VEIN C-terminal domain-containing protein n=1 Tax=Candidatus Phaeomarinibacter ectocarpi TaxID=1458461 RepID=X5MLF1_9HYPH|nr:DUF3883 domain-containing protein [Candidatus Phaeomarinobacter ectocarpi]CDO59435.1 FIG00989271: hypothetical protein [Candidatus Phaeomarinobacter ectocarpi]
MPGDDWTSDENDAVVADYFDMLQSELAFRSYNKAEHNRQLQSLIGRGRGSIEYKHQNISAVLKAMGEVWIGGYMPRFNFQMSLADAVARWLERNPQWLGRSPTTQGDGEMLQEPTSLWVGPAPTLSNEPEPDELQQTLAVARRYDVVGRDKRNRELGKAGERFVVDFERATLSQAGRKDLADLVRWVAEEDGDGAGYDVQSYGSDGRSRLIEVKTTNGWERTPFHITKNELAVADAKRDEWCLFRLWNFSREPKAFELYPPLDQHVSLTAETFKASFD